MVCSFHRRRRRSEIFTARRMYLRRGTVTLARGESHVIEATSTARTASCSINTAGQGLGFCIDTNSQLVVGKILRRGSPYDYLEIRYCSWCVFCDKIVVFVLCLLAMHALLSQSCFLSSSPSPCTHQAKFVKAPSLDKPWIPQ